MSFHSFFVIISKLASYRLKVTQLIVILKNKWLLFKRLQWIFKNVFSYHYDIQIYKFRVIRLNVYHKNYVFEVRALPEILLTFIFHTYSFSKLTLTQVPIFQSINMIINIINSLVNGHLYQKPKVWTVNRSLDFKNRINGYGYELNI